jgi:hypothetical protein
MHGGLKLTLQQQQQVCLVISQPSPSSYRSGIA